MIFININVKESDIVQRVCILLEEIYSFAERGDKTTIRLKSNRLIEIDESFDSFSLRIASIPIYVDSNKEIISWNRKAPQKYE